MSAANSSAAAEAYCRQYLDAESDFIRASGDPRTPAANLAALKDALLEALGNFAAHACDGWPDAATWRESERRRTEEWA